MARPSQMIDPTINTFWMNDPRRLMELVTSPPLLRAAACAAVLLVVYYLAPLDRALDAGAWILFVLGLVVFAVIVAYETRAIIASDVPRLRMIHAAATGLPTLLLVFAAIYVLIARDDPDSFSELLSRTDALYFTLTVFATVGFGEIAPRCDVARILTMIQMIMDLAAVGLIAKILLGAVDIAKQRRKDEAAENDDRSGVGERGRLAVLARARRLDLQGRSSRHRMVAPCHAAHCPAGWANRHRLGLVSTGNPGGLHDLGPARSRQPEKRWVPCSDPVGSRGGLHDEPPTTSHRHR